MSATHPLYEKHPAHRFAGILSGMLSELRKAALAPERMDVPAEDREADKDFTWFVLPAGAVVMYRVRSDIDLRGELRIARQEEMTDSAKKKWDMEVSVFLKHFGIRELLNGEPADDSRASARMSGGCFIRITHHNDREKTAVRFLELRPGEVSPGKARCHACFEKFGKTVIVEWFPGGSITGQACQVHAFDNGHRDSEMRMAQRLTAVEQESLL